MYETLALYIDGQFLSGEGRREQDVWDPATGQTIGKLQARKSQAAFCAVVRDITQWKKTEQELREAKERAEATSRQKSEF
ncbi:MAG TPA: NAD-dependent succinate-semialdehyde dehydrogenase, partial [Burkholderiaceae bacterium]|nr:NAD-dependent succinate-semialdehyde dehydrogenase [Burkholderiaceae bacterium]